MIKRKYWHYFFFFFLSKNWFNRLRCLHRWNRLTLYSDTNNKQILIVTNVCNNYHLLYFLDKSYNYSDCRIIGRISNCFTFWPPFIRQIFLELAKLMTILNYCKSKRWFTFAVTNLINYRKWQLQLFSHAFNAAFFFCNIDQ